MRAVFECRRAFPAAAIVGVGGVSCGYDAAELLSAGADAVQVGTASFVDPRAPLRVLRGAGGLVRIAGLCERVAAGGERPAWRGRGRGSRASWRLDDEPCDHCERRRSQRAWKRRELCSMCERAGRRLLRERVGGPE